ncbi:MAG: transcriptional regulator [Candidatus Tectimicrobiota bacterium]|nr:MAG: transcriptional regulator [Candidatus Tectomicrobia bacterium]
MTKEERALACEIGLTLRRLRRERGLTQKALAQRVAGGVDATYIGRIERGAQLPSLKALLRLAAALDVPIGTFFYPPPARGSGTAPALHLEPLLQALYNRGIDGVALVRALLDAIGQHVLVVPRRHPEEARQLPAIPLPQAGAASPSLAGRTGKQDSGVA